MSTQVDERVVQMTFDNEQFEKGIKTTLSSLKLFENTVQRLPGASAGLSKLQGAIKGFSFRGLGDGVDQVTAKFNVMDMVAAQVLANMVTNAINTGKKMVSSLSIDQISSGWQKYEDKTTSVQTILAATGKSMDVVSAQLEKLNRFTDETSYNFVDMVGNIGKFTSNNIDLEDSVTAMQGIATWAAISGANAGEASRAMYNLSQALSTGAVTLMDWKSIENANMATAQFKQNVIEIAAAQGVLKKVSKDTYQTMEGTEVSIEKFNASLSDKWFNKKILMEALDIYGGFANKLFEMMEDVEDEAPDMVATILKDIDRVVGGEDVTKVAKGLPKYAEMLRELSQSEYELGRKAFKAAQEAKTFTEALDATKDAVSTGWMNSFEYIFGNYEEAKQLWSDVAEELYNVFAASGEARNDMLRTWKELGGREKLLKRLGKSYTIVKNAIVRFKKAIGKTLFPEFYAKDFDSGEWFKKVTDSFGKGAKRIAKTFKSILSFVTPFIQAALVSIKNILGVVVPFIIKAGQTFGAAFKIGAKGAGAVIKGLKTLVEWVRTFTSQFKLSEDLLVGFAKAGEFLGKMFMAVLNTIGPVVKFVYQIIARVAKAISEVLSTDEMTEKFAKAGETLEKIFTTALDAIVPVVKFIFRVFKQVATAISQVVTLPTFQVISDSVLKFLEWAKAIVLTKERAKDLRRILRGLLSIFELVRLAISKLINLLKPVFTLVSTALGKIANKVVHFLGIVGQLIREFEKFVKGQKNSKKFLESVFGESVTKKILKVKKLLKQLKLPEFKFKPKEFVDSIFDAFKKLKENIAAAFDFSDGFDLGKILGGVTGAISQFVSDITGAGEENTNFSEIIQDTTLKLDAYGGTFEKVTSPIKTFVDNVKSIIGAAKKAYESIYDFGKKVYHVFKKYLDFVGFFKDLWKNLKTLREEISKIKNSGKSLKDTAESIGKALGDFLANVNVSFKGHFDVLGFAKEIQNVIGTVWGVLKNLYTGKENATLIDVIAKIFGDITGAIAGFFSHLFDGVNEDDVNTDQVSGFTKIIQKIFEPITEYLKTSDKDGNTIYENTKAIFGAFMNGIKAALGDLNFETLKQVGVFAAVVYLILQAMKTMKALSFTTNSFEDFIQSFTYLNGWLKKIAVSTKKYIDSQIFITVAKGIVLIALSMLALAQVPSDQLLRTAYCLAIVLGAVSVLIVAINELTKARGDKDSITGMSKIMDSMSELGENIMDTISRLAKIAGVGFIILAIGAAVVLIVKAFVDLLKLQEFVMAHWKKIIAAIGVIVIIMAALSACIVFMSRLGKERIGLGPAFAIVAIAAAVYLICRTMMGLLTIPYKRLAKVTVAVMGIVVAIGYAMGRMKKKVGLSSAVTIVALALAIRMLVGPLKDLSDVQVGQLIKAVAAVSALLVVMGVAVHLTRDVQSYALAAAMLAFAFGIRMIAEGLKVLDEVKNLGDVLMTFTVIVIALSAFAGLISFLSSVIPGLGFTLAGVGIMLAGVAAVFLAFGAAVALSADNFPAFADGLIYLAKAIVENAGWIIGAIVTVGIGIATALTMITMQVGLAWVGVLVGIVVMAISVLYQMEPGARDAVLDMLKNLVVGVALGLLDFIADIFGAFFPTIMYFIEYGGTKLFQGLSWVFEKLIEGLYYWLRNSIPTEGARKILDETLGKSIEGFKEALHGYREGLDESFAETTETFYAENADNWIIAAAAGFAKDTDEAADQLITSADELKHAIAVANDINYKAGPNAPDTLAPNVNSYVIRAKDLKEASEIVVDAAETVKTGNTDLVNEFNESTEKLNISADNLNNAKDSVSNAITGWYDDFKNTADVQGVIGNVMGGVDSALKDYGLDATALEIFQGIPDAMNLTDWGSAENVLRDDLLNSIILPGKDTLGVNSPSKVFADIFQGIPEALELVDWTVGDEKIVAGVTHISNTAKTAFESADVGSSVNAAVTNAVSSASDAFIAADTSRFADGGANAYSAYAGGISKKSDEMKTELSKAMLAAIRGANGYIDRFRTLGQQAGAGFINGMRSKLTSAAEAGAAIARAAMKAVETTQDSHSPSRVTRKFGTFFSQGYINGILSLRSAVESAATDVGYAAINGTASQMAKISSILDSGVDIHPVIAPVMDLSNVHSGVNSITGLMGQTYELANVNARMSAEKEYSSLNDIAAILNGLSFDSDNTDVVAAVNSLSADIANLGLAIQSMKIQLGGKTVGVINSGLGQRQMMQNRGVSNG